MIRNRLVLKSIAVFLILETVFNVVSPTISWALTAGPTAPEFSSFEPVDTTDMVNLVTGDLAYNMPLINVPGPNGDYAMSLSYHAGINPGLEASWVGLGWTCNPGAISRLVNGYPDDHNNAVINNHFYWGGQSRTTYSIGISTSFAMGASVTAGLSFTQDSHRGFSVNPYAGGSLDVLPGIGISADSRTGTAQVSAPGLSQLKMLENIKNNHEVSTSMPFGPASLGLTYNLSSRQLKGKFSLGAYSKDVSREGRVSTEKSHLGITIPFPQWGFNINLARDYMRQWIDENAAVSVHGALHFPTARPDYSVMTGASFDSYDLLSDDAGTVKLDPERETGGSFVNYDQYTVNAQGLTGTMRPFHYYEYLYRQNRSDNGTAISRGVPLADNVAKIGFRFDNDFSNRFTIDSPSPTFNSNGGLSINLNPSSIVAGKGGQGYADNILEGSKHVEYFTNHDIASARSESVARGYLEAKVRSALSGVSVDDEQIVAFNVTAENGMTYHFSLPAYSYGEYSYSEKIVSESLTYNEVTKGKPYAYTWLLTAITGPDFVDREGTNGGSISRLGPEDWGYWIEFGYEQWSNDYGWRNPVTGFKYDLDHNFKNYSRGKKQIYYLDYIRTASHVAVFDKSQRFDGRGVQASGGFSTASNLATKKLDQIYILPYADFQSAGGFPALGDLDSFRANITAKSQRVVKFNYTYELTPRTENSFSDDPTSKRGKLTLKSLKFCGHGGADLLPAHEFSYQVADPVVTRAVVSPVTGSPNLYNFFGANSGFEVGDVIRLQLPATDAYGQITAISGDRHDFMFIEASATPMDFKSVVISETKNPPYNAEKYDMWGLYKTDFFPGQHGDPPRLTTALSGHAVDVWSLQSIRAPLGSSIDIHYEPDTYDEIVLNSDDFSSGSTVHQALRVKDAERLSSTSMRIRFYNDGFDLFQLFALNKSVDISIFGAYLFNDMHLNQPATPGCHCPYVGYAYHEAFTGRSTVSAIEPGTYSIIITDSQTSFVSRMSGTRVSTIDPNTYCGPGNEPISCFYDVSGWPSFIAGGMVFSNTSPERPGGIRVKSIAVRTGAKTKTVRYTYQHGVTSYEPTAIPGYELKEGYYQNLNTESLSKEIEELSTLYSAAAMQRYSNLLNMAREVPPPGVMYKRVDRRGSFTDMDHNEVPDPTWESFAFQTFKKDMVKYRSAVTHNTVNGSASGLNYVSRTAASVTIDDLSSAVGNIKSMVTYDASGNPLSQTTYSYLHDPYLETLNGSGYTHFANELLGKFDLQGLTKESFADSRVVKSYNTPYYRLIGIMSRRNTYPSVTMGQQTTNFKTGITTSNTTIGFDFFSGEQTRSLQTDGYGNAYITETVPAYTKYDDMGLALSGGAHMLSQQAASYTYAVDPVEITTKLGLVSASVQTWSDQIGVLEPGENTSQPDIQPGIWRQHRGYSFIGNDNTPLVSGLYPLSGGLPEFTSWADQRNQIEETPAGWQKSGEVSLYDVYSHSLEASDMNDQFVATKLMLSQDIVLATVANAEYREFAYSGAEEQPTADRRLGGGVYAGSSVSTSSAHTGSRSVLAAASGANNRGFTYFFVPRQRTYHVSVWSSNSQAKIKYKFDTTSNPEKVATPTVSGVAAGWYLIEADIPITESLDRLEVWCEAPGTATYFDDFRIHPVDAAMNSYVYNKWGELSHILDNNNLYTEYRYDDMGRLRETFAESFQANGSEGIFKVSDVNYNYGINSPVMVSLTVTATGRGDASPSGTISVKQGDAQSISIVERCESPFFQGVWVDGKEINLLTQASVYLVDGTVVQKNGNTINLRNIQSPHHVQVRFIPPQQNTRGYRCEYKNNCNTGFYDYYTSLDPCGNPIWITHQVKRSLPDDIEPATNTCCVGYTDCGCRIAEP